MLKVGDLVRVTLLGATEDDAASFLGLMATSDEFGTRLTAIPTLTKAVDGGEFGGLSLAQEFIVGAGAELTAEAVVAGIRAIARRWSCRQKTETVTPEIENVTITASVPSDGLYEIIVRADRRH